MSRYEVVHHLTYGVIPRMNARKIVSRSSLALAAAGLLVPSIVTAGQCGTNRAGGMYQPGYAYYGPMRPMPPRGGPYGYRPPVPGYGYAGRAPGYGMAAMQPGAARATGTQPEPESKPATPAGGSVRISQMRFDPPRLTVQAGETVTWTQADTMPHTVTSNDGTLGSSTLNRGSSFSHTFDQPGTYEYVCSLHPGMRGQIVVE